jgi:transposase InsO family protein
VASALFSRWLCRHGLPLEIVPDNGKEFCNGIVDTLLKLMGIKKTNTTPYHPQTNAQAKVCNKTIAAYLETCMYGITQYRRFGKTNSVYHRTPQ